MSHSHKYSNELTKESSPYLLQHAHNPVNWVAWSKEAFELAQREKKLVLISVGYSSCHWCHVMEKESFESEEVAKYMNEHFVCIKVDREERPDVDAIYMKALQMMTGQGGWPLNIVCLPDGRPIWGATYVNKTNWMESLRQLAHLFQNNPEKVIEYAEKMKEGLNALGLVSNKSLSDEFPFENIHLHIEKWKKSFDLEFGGYSRAPKFMMPTNYEFLLKYGYQTQNQELLSFVDLTLTKMAYGGLFDTVDGGFSRYSVAILSAFALNPLFNDVFVQVGVVKFSLEMPIILLLPIPFMAFGLGGLFTLMMSMTADVCDLDELKNGLPRREGTFGAIYWWMVKIGQSIALALGGLVLSLVGFDAKSTIQAAETMHNLRIADIIIPSFTAALAVLIMWNYSLNEDRVSNIKKELEARRALKNQSNS